MASANLRYLPPAMPHLQTQSHRGLGFLYMNLGGQGHSSVYNSNKEKPHI